MKLVHWADFNAESEVSIVIAECGASGAVLGDGSLSPSDFDFAPSLEAVTCEACIRGKMAKVKAAGKRAARRRKAAAN